MGRPVQHDGVVFRREGSKFWWMSKKYSQMKLQMKRQAVVKINRRANEMPGVLAQQGSGDRGFDTVEGKT
jgi:hypothetical protein